jgi:hypothetical protein
LSEKNEENERFWLVRLDRNMQKSTMILKVLLIVMVIAGTVLGLRIVERFGA